MMNKKNTHSMILLYAYGRLQYNIHMQLPNFLTEFQFLLTGFPIFSILYRYAYMNVIL